jgi:VWFA-related protein
MVAPAQEDLPLFKTGVDIVLAPVVVRDSGGKAVSDLRPEDFELKDSGKTRKIESFSLETREGARRTAPGQKAGAIAAMPADAPDRFVTYLFDDANTGFGDLARSSDAARRHFKALAPSDRAAIFTTSGTVTQEFTADRALLEKATRRLSPHSRRAHSCPSISYYLANAYLSYHDPDAFAVINEQVQRCTPNLPPSVARNRAEGAARIALDQGDLETRTTLATILNVIQRMARLPGSRSIVFASPGFINPQALRDQAALTDRAIATGTVIHTLDVRGVYGDNTADVSHMEVQAPLRRARNIWNRCRKARFWRNWPNRRAVRSTSTATIWRAASIVWQLPWRFDIYSASHRPLPTGGFTT